MYIENFFVILLLAFSSFLSCINKTELTSFADLAGVQLTYARSSHTATLLNNGNVAVIGGIMGKNTLASIETFSRENQQFAYATSLKESRYMHTSTLLPNGKIVIVGGINMVNGAIKFIKEVEEYDPKTKTVKIIGHLETARSGHKTVLFDNNKLIVVGGDNPKPLNTSEIFNLEKNKTTSIQYMNYSRTSFALVGLSTGDIVVLGGHGDNPKAIEKFDKEQNRFEVIGSLQIPRYIHKAAALNDRQILIVGGFDGRSSLASVEIFDLVKRVSSLVTTMSVARDNLTLTLIPNGKVLVAGGANLGRPWNTTEIYDPEKRKFESYHPMQLRRDGHTATLLPDQTVLMIGGFDGITQRQLRNAEILSLTQ